MLDEAILLGSATIDEAARADDRPIDPLDEDRADDGLLVTTERRLRRLAIVAADVGARFARERSGHDPVAWMLSRRALFGGARGIDACQDRTDFVRATLLHGLSLGLDADPEEIDELLSDDPEDGEPLAEVAPRAVRPSPAGRVDLYTAVVEGRIGSSGRVVQAYCAMTATDEETVRRRLGVRYGAVLAAAAEVVRGHDPEEPLARALLSDELSSSIAAAAADPGGPWGEGLDVQVERRLAL